MAQVALICGASSGLGREMAQAMAKAGYITYAGARSFAGDVKPPEGCIALALDATSDESVNAAISRIIGEQGRMDVLINCAARIVLGAVEELDEDELGAVMETNFFGSVRVIRAVLPHMRAQKSGRVVQFSSINGLLAIPFTGAYIASKHALEGYLETLSQELLPFNTHVMIVEPGDAKSGSSAYRLMARRASDENSPYRAAFLAATGQIARDEAGGMEPARISKRVVFALSKKHPPARMCVAPLSQRAGVWLHDLLPTRLFCRLIYAMYAKNRVPEKGGHANGEK